MRFFVGLHQPSDAQHFEAAFVSVNRLRTRKSAFAVGDWIMDSGAFTEVSTHGTYRLGVQAYADEIKRWAGNGRLLAAVSQDWMCEDFILEKTARVEGLLAEGEKLTPQTRAERIAVHQRRTIERYDELIAANTGVYIMPVLQGFASKEYINHLHAYGDRLKPGMWVGVGSICKRNGNPLAIWKVLDWIKDERPDLHLHGFGLKTTSLKNPIICGLLETADSMAWSFAARRQGRSANSWREAKAFIEDIATAVWSSQRQPKLLLGAA